MLLNTKAKSYKVYYNWGFGNKLRTWDSLQKVLEDKFTGKVTMRVTAHYPEKYLAYALEVEMLAHVQKEWEKQGVQNEHITFNEAPPDNHLLIQGEVMKTPWGLQLSYSTEPNISNRKAMENPKVARGLIARLMLEHFLSPSSWEDLQELFEKFPEHVVEFSCYSKPVGEIHGRNTVIWEVRHGY